MPALLLTVGAVNNNGVAVVVGGGDGGVAYRVAGDELA